MPTTKHTPGPWDVVHVDRGLYGINDGRTGDRIDDAATHADVARLIAAAPEMLEALRRFAGDACTGAGACSDRYPCAPCAARAAIAKAEGR